MTRHALSLLLIPALVGSVGCDRLRGRVQVTVQGTLLGADGRPMPMAHARLLGENPMAPLETVAADREGRFTLRKALQPGAYSLAFAGVGHEPTEMRLHVKASRAFQVQVKLGTLEVARDLSGAGLMVEDGSGRPNRIPLAAQGDGTWAADITGQGSTVRYQVDHALCLTPGVLSRCAMEGTQGSGYEPVADGYYKNILPLEGGRARVVFDPRRLPTGSREAAITFGPKDRDLAETWRIDQERWAIVLFQTAQRAELQSSLSELLARRKAFHQTFSRRWIEALGVERDPAVRRALGSALLIYGPKDMAALLKAFPPESPFWDELSASDRRTLAVMCHYAGDSALPALRSIALDHLDLATWKQQILPLLAFRGPEQAARELAELEALRPGHPLLKELRHALEASRARLAVGQPFPRFQLPSLEDPKQSLSLDAFKGKWLLVDVWATWCKPCVGELPGLHRASEAFKGRGLEVLSLSFDARPEDIQAYRQSQRMPMPWKHAWLEKGSEHPFAKELEVVSIPRVFLVGPDGTIRAMDDELKGPALEKTLARLLAKP